MNWQGVSGAIRRVQGSKGGLLLLLVLSADWQVKFSKLAAAEGPEHPYVDEKDLKSGICLICHPTKNRGKFVHSAVALGCQSCHQANSRDGHTTITLLAQGGNLCAKCHIINRDHVQHEPYAKGACLVCHNPHSAAYEGETRADLSMLCLGCHMLDQPEATMSADRKQMLLFDGVPYDAAAWERAPKINARHAEEKPPAAEREPSDRPRHLGDAAPNCLICHEPHASRTERLLRSGARIRVVARPVVGGRPSPCLSVKSGLNRVPQAEGSYLRGQFS